MLPYAYLEFPHVYAREFVYSGDDDDFFVHGTLRDFQILRGR